MLSHKSLRFHYIQRTGNTKLQIYLSNQQQNCKPIERRKCFVLNWSICFVLELLYLNSTFQKYVISHCIAIGQQFQSSSSKSNCILVFHRAGTETKTSQGTLFKSLGHDFRSAKTTYSYFSTQRRWIYLYDSCLA